MRILSTLRTDKEGGRNDVVKYVSENKKVGDKNGIIGMKIELIKRRCISKDSY